MESRERVPEGDALRQLARQLAAVADTEELLSILCDAAQSQACAIGAAVVRAEGKHALGGEGHSAADRQGRGSTWHRRTRVGLAH